MTRLSLLAPALGLLTAGILPVAADAQSMTDCLLAHNQGVVTPVCARMLGLSTTSPEPQAPPDNGGIHLKPTLAYQPLGNALGQASIVGLTLGQSQANATTAMKAYCGTDPEVTNTYLSTTYKGVDVKTQFFPSQMVCHKEQDNLTVHLSPPVMGTVVTRIERNVTFPSDASPRFAELQGDIASKYGLHLPPLRASMNEERTLYADARGQTGEKENGGPVNAMDPMTYEVPGEMAHLLLTTQPVMGNPSHVANISFDLQDIRAERAIGGELLKQMNGSVDAKLANSDVKPAL
ncbi:hypothetical protein AA101099_2924 [Neoasaia chiangmaiensis NBRC 101099]|uniref:Uncharacterized protein n=1 Tax=Neoasaia chiangmaiensis TaxID=320497 RepID=A0A1U9KNU9_9PROT|nr:hypothetical protein [Neoasaia chiangmaiensis]AQS87468.1 hypothetical protein A0U93_05410 [Neoasaia chiangmaiensis]GBR42602.1 hypothetical protein AA101099_2924 [Neoasaia chiangmaiensis NBRC 101099]GEN16256.1 hypothetical protein NCH01_26870 [Neoasaia chiangmaiensis]